MNLIFRLIQLRIKEIKLKRILFHFFAWFIILLVFITTLELIARAFIAIEEKTVRLSVSKQFQNENSLKIICIGDSHTFGAEVPKGHSYPDHLRELHRTNCSVENIEIINFGDNGKDLIQLYSDLKNWLKEAEYEPDIIILQGGINAFHSDKYLEQFVNSEGIDLSFWLESFMFFRLSRLFYLEDRILANANLQEEYNQYIQIIIAKQVSEMVVDFNNRNIKTILLTYASGYGYKEKACDAAMMSNSEKYNLPFVRFKQPATAVFYKTNKLTMPYGHPDSFGYKIMAQVVYFHLKKNDLLPNYCKDVKVDLPEYLFNN